MTSAEAVFPESPSSSSSHSPSSESQSFDDILAEAKLPPPGPDHYAARRRLWLASRPNLQHAPVVPSTSRRRLEHILSAPHAVEDDDVWRNGVAKVWNTLSAGGRLKRRLPMALIVKVIHAAWLRDGTWPAGAVAPEPDDVLPDDLSTSLVDPSITGQSSAVTAPWMVAHK
ncbi:hypothetical protein LshimejAT787_0108580 [Lyophyllum shimeji]|uniref:DUF4050 domain-containing protein n=1 Tax=Lyophyllum shimeji TaxID=47721 RepID=A0A9P3PEE9_LYOSH|nr:hypothetical protein LshimejAT787_0108580 [Lyophyllum shimeji]